MGSLRCARAHRLSVPDPRPRRRGDRVTNRGMAGLGQILPPSLMPGGDGTCSDSGRQPARNRVPRDFSRQGAIRNFAPALMVIGRRPHRKSCHGGTYPMTGRHGRRRWRLQRANSGRTHCEDTTREAPWLFLRLAASADGDGGGLSVASNPRSLTDGRILHGRLMPTRRPRR
jgi:hypothetical protein